MLIAELDCICGEEYILAIQLMQALAFRGHAGHRQEIAFGKS
jgi:hypothetical protein